MDIWIFSISIALLFFLSVFIVMKLSDSVIGLWYSPLTLFLVRWLALLSLVLLNFANYDPIRPTTWLMVLLSMLAFTLGAALPMFAWSERGERTFSIPDMAAELRKTVDPVKFKGGIYALFGVGLALLLVYINSIRVAFGLETILYSPYVIRAAIAGGSTPAGFHFFYVMEAVSALAWLYVCLYRRRTPPLMFAMGGIATGALVLTTAKVNIVKVVVWAVIIVIYLNLHRLNFRRLTILSSFLVASGLILFVALSNWGSEIFEQGLWYRYLPSYSGIRGTLFSAYIYNTGQIPALDKLIHDGTVEFQYGKLTLLPLVKTVRLFDGSFDVPSHIGEFYNIPLPFNVATYLDVMYKDFGLLGMVILPFMLGFLILNTFMRLLHGRVSLWLFYINTVFALWVFASASAASYLKPSYWFQIGVGFVIAYYATRHVAAKRPWAPPRSVQKISR